MGLSETEQQSRNLKLVKIYNAYRVVIGLIFVLTSFGADGLHLIANNSAFNLQAFALSYFSINLLLLLSSRPTRLDSFAICFIDLIMLSILLALNAQLYAMVGKLMLISVAAGNILLSGRIGTLLAAIATIATLGVSSYHSLFSLNSQIEAVDAGLQGLMFFVSALSIQYIVQRLNITERLAKERKRQYRSLQRLNKSIIQRMRTGIVVMDEKQDILLQNEAATHLLQAEDQATDLAHLSPQLDSNYQAWRLNAQRRPEPFRADAKRPKVQANFTQVTEGEDKHTLIFLDDISAMTQQAQQLKLASLGRLTAGIAHEIRNPLGAISHAAQLLEESEHLDDDDKRLLQIIQNHSLRMNKVIENVLQLSRRRESSPEPLALSSWLKDYVEHDFNLNEHQPEITLSLAEDELMVQMDPAQLLQVMGNLCQNGLRYSSKHTGKATLAIRCGTTVHSQQPFLEVRDQGSGVSKEVSQTLFEPFFTTEASGTGLGLYISKQLCEGNQASLELMESKQGCVFRITFAHPAKRLQ